MTEPSPTIDADDGACHGPTCVTCADQADRIRIEEVDGTEAQGVDERGRRMRVDVSLVGPVGPGDEVLVHGGVAITSLDAAEVTR